MQVKIIIKSGEKKNSIAEILPTFSRGNKIPLGHELFHFN